MLGIAIMKETHRLRPKAERRKFKAHFGSTAKQQSIAWKQLLKHSLLPEKSEPKHLLWALLFMKSYASEDVLCSKLGSIDDNTLRKWVWAFIVALSKLCNRIVSNQSNHANSF